MVIHRILALQRQTQTPRDVRESPKNGFTLVCACGWRSVLAKDPKQAYILYSDHRRQVWDAARSA